MGSHSQTADKMVDIVEGGRQLYDDSKAAVHALVVCMVLAPTNWGIKNVQEFATRWYDSSTTVLQSARQP